MHVKLLGLLKRFKLTKKNDWNRIHCLIVVQAPNFVIRWRHRTSLGEWAISFCVKMVVLLIWCLSVCIEWSDFLFLYTNRFTCGFSYCDIHWYLPFLNLSACRVIWSPFLLPTSLSLFLHVILIKLFCYSLLGVSMASPSSLDTSTEVPADCREEHPFRMIHYTFSYVVHN